MLVRLTASLEQNVTVESFDLMIQLLERSSITSAVTSRTGYISQLAHCLFSTCADVEQQLQVHHYLTFYSGLFSTVGIVVPTL